MALSGVQAAQEQAEGHSEVQRGWDFREARSLFGLLSAAIVSALSMAVGVGGGGILVPIFNLVLGFGVKTCTALSQSTIAASGIGACIFSLLSTHPQDASRPLVDATLALALLPSLLLGMSFGVLLNVLLPSWIVTFAIIGVLSYMASRTMRVARMLQSQEKAAVVACIDLLVQAAQDAERGSTDEEEGCVNGGETDYSNGTGHGVEGGDVALGDSPCSQHFLHQLCLLLGLWVAFSVLQLGKSFYPRCTWRYASLYTCQVVLTLGCTLVFTRQGATGATHGSVELQPQRERGQPVLHRSDSDPVTVGKVVWSQSHLDMAAYWAAAAGVIAGVIGMGGGFLLNPIMLEFGVDPQVSAATSSFMVLFASASAALSFAAEGRLNLQFALVFGITCGAAGFGGASGLSRAVKKHGASSVVFLLAAIIGLGALATAVFSGRQALQEMVSGQSASLKDFCL